MHHPEIYKKGIFDYTHSSNSFNKLIIHTDSDTAIAEALSDAMIINHEQDVIPLVEELFAIGSNKIIALFSRSIDLCRLR